MSEYSKFFDQFSPRFQADPQSNVSFLLLNERWANDRLIANGVVFLNEVYEMLGIPRTSAGQIVGWVLDRDEPDKRIDFGLRDGKNGNIRAFINGYEPAILLDFNVDGVVYDKLR